METFQWDLCVCGFLVNMVLFCDPLVNTDLTSGRMAHLLVQPMLFVSFGAAGGHGQCDLMNERHMFKLGNLQLWVCSFVFATLSRLRSTAACF